MELRWAKRLQFPDHGGSLVLAPRFSPPATGSFIRPMRRLSQLQTSLLVGRVTQTRLGTQTPMRMTFAPRFWGPDGANRASIRLGTGGEHGHFIRRSASVGARPVQLTNALAIGNRARLFAPTAVDNFVFESEPLRAPKQIYIMGANGWARRRRIAGEGR